MLVGTGVDEELVKWLDDNGFFTAPATTKYHHSFPGGLALHSIEVANILVSLANTFGVKRSENELIRLGLLHDISKTNYFKLTSINKKVYTPDGSKWDELGNFEWKSEVGYKVVDVTERDTFGNFGFKSYMKAKDYVDFSNDDITALCNYLYVVQPNDAGETIALMDVNPTLVLLHMADTASSYLLH